MSKGTISTTVTTQVVLGGPDYGSNLDITQSGTIAVALPGRAAIDTTPDRIGVFIDNHGSVLGSNGRQPNPHGGDGIALHGGGTLVNTGLIKAGNGNDTYGGRNPNGGTGVSISGYGDISNDGSIVGGDGANGSYFSFAYQGGAGISIGRSGKVTNHGVILGGSSGSFAYYATARGGPPGLVIGGYGNVANSGTIIGGAGGQGSLFGFGAYGYQGGNGIELTKGGVVTNTGLIEGGSSGDGSQGDPLGGGGIFLGASALVINEGSISSGASHYNDKNPIDFGVIATVHFAETGTLINTGNIIDPGNDAYGVLFGGVGTISNAGVINGGSGVGIDLSAGGTLINRGEIAGYGYGVQIAGGTLEALAGTITGTATASGPGDAVQLGTLAGTLIVSPHAVFDGDIAGNPGAADTLVLDNGGPGTLSGFGSTFTGFSALDTPAKANWTLNGTITGLAAADLGAGASLTFGGPATIGSLAFASSGGGKVVLDAPDSFAGAFSGFSTGDSIILEGIEAYSFSYQNGTLTLLGFGNTTVGTLDFSNFLTRANFHVNFVSGGTKVTYASTASLEPGWAHMSPWHW